MTKTLDELDAPKAMSLDELFAAIRPPPLLPVRYEPSDSNAFMPASSAAGVDAPQRIPPDRLWSGIQTAPPGPLNYPGAASEAPLQPAGQPNGNDAELLARLIFAEAAHEYDGPGVYDAIAHAVLNRVGQPGFRKNLRDVIFMPKQFASVGGELWNKAADPSTLEPENARAYARALSTANAVLSGLGANLPDPTHGATYFYSGKPAQPPSGSFSDRIKSGVLARTEEYPPFVFWKDVRQGKR